MSNDTRLNYLAQALETDAMTATFGDPHKPMNPREQAIYNAAYIRGRKDFADEDARAKALR